MPNNTANKLQFMFFGDKGERLNQIEELLKSEVSDLDFEKIIPLNGLDPNDVWGTKWNAYNIHKIRSEAWSLNYLFDTAWNYPEPVLNAILEKFPDVNFSFASACEGGWFALAIKRNDDGGEIERVEFTDELGNDPGGYVRGAMLAALDM